jgi:hypothetical protein
VFVVVEGFPEADPDVEQSQAAAQAAKEAGGDQGTKPGKREQQIVVGPLRGPGQDHEEDAGDSADQDEKENGSAVQPKLQRTVRPGRHARRWRVQERGAGFGRWRRGLRRRGIADGRVGFGHWALRGCVGGASQNQDPSLRSG